MREKNRKFHRSYQADKGVALIVAVLIISVLIVFTFTLTLVAYSLYSSQNKNLSSMKCSEAANSLSIALSDELRNIDSVNKRYPEYDSYLYLYLRYNLFHSDKTWPYYDPSKEGHGKDEAFRYFSLKYNSKKTLSDENGNPVVTTGEGGVESTVSVDHVEGLPAKTEVCIYWELPVENKDDPQAGNKPVSNALLTVEVTCEAANQSYTARKEYKLSILSYGDSEEDVARQVAMKEAGKKDMVNPCAFSYETESYPDEFWKWELVEQ